MRPCCESLNLRIALALSEDVWIRNRDDVGIALKVFARNFEFLCHLAVRVIQIPAVQTRDDLEHPRLRGMKPGMDGTEHRGTLLDQGLSRAHWRVARDVSDLLFCCRDDALSCSAKEAHELE